MNTKQFVDEILQVLEKARAEEEYINPHILDAVVGSISITGDYTVPHAIDKWSSDMWSW